MQTASQGAWQPNHVIFFFFLAIVTEFSVEKEKKYGAVSESTFNCFLVGFLCSGVESRASWMRSSSSC